MRLKHAFDWCAAIAGLAVLSPALCAIALLVKLEDGGPVFFRQERVGQHGRLFKIWKFRTMVVDAGKKGRHITVGDDPRITRIGCWLRKCKVDEFPQFWNVIRGEMSLVGPRPEVPRYVALYSQEQRRVLELRPGITDPASLKYHDEAGLLGTLADPDAAYIHDIMPEKIRINLEYAAKATPWTDLKTIFQTMGVLHRR